MFGTSAIESPRPLSTGHLLADCERWCRDTLRPREVLRPAPVLRIVVTPPPVAAQAPARRGTFLPGAGRPGVAAARTGS